MSGNRCIEENVRHYRYEATSETVEMLRLLREPWSGIRVEPSRVTIRLADAREIRLEVEGADPEPGFEAFRISAAGNSDEPALDPRFAGERPPFRDAPDFATGRNDVVMFAGATWIDGAEGRVGEPDPVHDAHPPTRPLLGRNPIIQFSGHPAQVPESAAAVCQTTDAVVIATPSGMGFLIRTALQPYVLEVTDDAASLDRFLRERGYGSPG